MAVRFAQAVKERNVALLTATFRDETGAALPAASLASVTLTLYDRDTQAIINSRSNQSILNANGGTVDANGLLTLTLATADNPILDDTKKVEQHVALVRWTYGIGGVKEGREEFLVDVENLELTP